MIITTQQNTFCFGPKSFYKYFFIFVITTTIYEVGAIIFKWGMEKTE